MTTQEQIMSERLRKEALLGYKSAVDCPVYNEAINTLAFLQMAFADRGRHFSSLVPLRFMQEVCTLGITGFEDAGGFQEYKKGIPSSLEKIWLLFATTLIHYVRKHEGADDEPIFFGCFEIPNWFVDESRAMAFKYFD